MTKQQIIDAFIEELDTQYGKSYHAGITVSRAVEVLQKVIQEDNTL
jgi:hypothetical protein